MVEKTPSRPAGALAVKAACWSGLPGKSATGVLGVATKVWKLVGGMRPPRRLPCQERKSLSATGLGLNPDLRKAAHRVGLGRYGNGLARLIPDETLPVLGQLLANLRNAAGRDFELFRGVGGSISERDTARGDGGDKGASATMTQSRCGCMRFPPGLRGRSSTRTSHHAFSSSLSWRSSRSTLKFFSLCA